MPVWHFERSDVPSGRIQRTESRPETGPEQITAADLAADRQRKDIMREEDIRRYAQLMKELDLSGLEVDEKNETVRLERSRISAEPVRLQMEGSAAAQTVPGAIPAPAPASGPAGASESEASSGNWISVTSPMVGMFYIAPAENADPYVCVGEKVEKGATLCIIEAMKLMNEIPAEESGTILEICAVNGQMVEYGTELFRIGRG